MIRSENRRKRPKFEKFPVKFPVSREFDPETGSPPVSGLIFPGV
jgi:hypothetical protein